MYVCVCMPVCIYVTLCICRCLWVPKTLDPPKLKLQVGVTCLKWALGTKRGSSAEAVSTLSN